MGVCRVLNWTKEVTCDCFVMFFDVFFLCSCLSASFVWYRKGDVCRGGITVLNSRSCKTQGCHFLQSSLFIYAFLVVWLGLNQILSILLLFFSHPILERWNRNFSSNLFQPQWGTMSGGVAWLQRGRDEHMAGFWSMHLSWFIIRSSSPKVKPHWGPSVCVFVPCERVEDGGRAHVGYGVNDFVVTFSIFFGSCKKTRSTFQDCKLSFLLTLPQNKASYPKLTEKTGVGKCSFWEITSEILVSHCIPIIYIYIHPHWLIFTSPWYFHDT